MISALASLSSGVTERYEFLRRESLSSGWPTVRGWAMFVRRGLLAWSLVWKDPPQSQPPSPPSPMTVVCPKHLDQALIRIMAGMVMNARREARHAL
ncbi:MAG: hypothetical protein HQL73_01915 [Magnetococcales bacterium]|nr:hypothetical protein [Magnetococcales bacterium]